MSIFWNESSWPQIKEALASQPPVFLPVGSIEQHGPHLPVGVDLFQAEQLARGLAHSVGGFVLPHLPYGFSYNHMRFPGTIAVSGESLKCMVVEIGESLAAHGVTNLVLVNSHGGNSPALRMAAQIINQKHPPCRAIHLFWLEIIATELKEILRQRFGTHADESETSLMMYLYPELVDMDLVTDEIPPRDENFLRDFLGQGYFSIQEETRSGVLGEATYASAEKGRVIYDLAVEKLSAVLRAAMTQRETVN